jgi:ABC-type polysaccharide/polyol phosphate transport system ATPase subunit
MSNPQIAFDHVVKRFAKGSYQDSMRDLLGALFRRGAADQRRKWFNALDDVSFEIAAGESVGLIGPNGSGKSTALKLLTGIYLPTSGTVAAAGRIAPLIEVGAGFHPDLSGRENIYLNAAITGMSRAEIETHFDEIVEFSGLAEFLDTPVKRYSSGMYMRLGFSIAAHVPSDILVVDEVLAVGDVAFRAKCVERMQQVRREGRTILFVSHHGPQVRSVCDRVVYLLHGKKVFDGDAADGTRRYEADILAGRVGAPGAAGHAAADSPAKLVSTQIAHDVSDEGVVLATTDPLEVRVRYRVTKPMPAAPQVSVGLLRGDGVMACVLATHEKGFALPGGVGDHEVTARFDALPVYPMRYGVEVILWDATGLVAMDQASAGGVEVRLEGRSPINRPGVFEPAGGFRTESA